MSSPEARRRALIIDDDAMQRLLIGSVARMAGYEADTVATISEAVGAMRQRAYDIVAVDLSLGDQDGVEAIRLVAETGQKPALLVISGLDDRIRDGALRFGQSVGLPAFGSVRKPVDVAQLRVLLQGDLPAPLSLAANRASATLTREALAEALASGEIKPHYQPKVDLASGRITGVEALARWTSPIHGLLSPGAFVPFAEQEGLSSELTDAILRQAVRDAGVWATAHPNVSVAVNVTAGALLDLDFPDRVEETLAEAGLSPSLLTVEVTESVALGDDPRVGDVLTRLRIKGVELSLDDFGTGYASLSSLLRMPFSELKIDRTFIQAADQDEYAWKIVRATLSLAREFGMKTVAEGIETETVAERLRQARCDVGQGYLFARPKPLPMLLDRLERAPTATALPHKVLPDPHFRRH
ncbi:diguanylate phosphodiesterase [Alsobacter soli]|uniref:Diguanylate phosphodiesterase n=1 Tax=Alsobacter soli TaxID=2109933 RepID=A0A2T1HVT2_9HYPH|nr:EAL domain-containing response regulator [Alsobacter soli]PSC05728.1 diguanylate phosphodiesterase [Alsobacter soli]